MISRKKPIDQSAVPSHDEIAKLAFEIYESEGRPVGREADHWFEAEQQLVHQRHEPVPLRHQRHRTLRRSKTSTPAT